ncbi:MAG: hypothetical protein K2O34_05285 [Acetatifactor sp.]|nr:hypothetical protein [Acetatifactor sp.]
MKEKYTLQVNLSSVGIEENRIISFNKRNELHYSFRVQEEGCLGVHYQIGEMEDDEGYARAGQNLALKRPYPFMLETGRRSRDKTERVFTDRQLMDIAGEALEHVHSLHPDFTLKGNFLQSIIYSGQENDRGLDYSNRDCNTDFNFSFKHKDSRELSDGWFSIGQRDFDPQKLYAMADNYLTGFGIREELPGEILVQMQYYDLLGQLTWSLNAENMCLGTSLLSGRVGEKVFADHFSLAHDVSDEECWNTPFFDGEGVTQEGDRLPYIENGVVLRGYADKRTAAKYGVEHTGSAFRTHSDIPNNGNVNLRIQRSDKTIRELLDGRLSIVPVRYSGGFNEKGEWVMPVQMAYLCDGERLLGRLPEFTLVSSMFDMFGKDFIGVGSDNPVFNDKSILVRMNLGKN